MSYIWKPEDINNPELIKHQGVEIDNNEDAILSKADFLKRVGVSDAAVENSRVPDLRAAAKRQQKWQVIADVFNSLVDTGRVQTGALVNKRGNNPYLASTLQRLRALDQQELLEDRLRKKNALYEQRVKDKMYADYVNTESKLEAAQNAAKYKAAQEAAKQKIDYGKWVVEQKEKARQADNRNATTLQAATLRRKNGSSSGSNSGNTYAVSGKEFSKAEMLDMSRDAKANLRRHLEDIKALSPEGQAIYKALLKMHLGEDAIEDIENGAAVSADRAYSLLRDIIDYQDAINELDKKKEAEKEREQQQADYWQSTLQQQDEDNDGAYYR